MGSILNLLNPLTIPPPAQTSSPQSRKRGAANEEGGSEEASVTLDAEVECNTPVESHGMRATHQARESIENKLNDGGQPSVVEGVVSSSSKEDGGRRTSSSSIADILNPLQDSQVTSSNGYSEVSSSGKVIPKDPTSRVSLPLEQLEPPSPSIDLSSNVQSILDHENEEMDIDVVGAEEPVSTQNIGSSNSVIPAPPIPTSQPMQPSASTDSQATISDTIEPITTNNPLVPSRSPSPSKKRKFTPESSPDEPLSAGLPAAGSYPLHLETDAHEQISVEKPQPVARAIKKPKRPTQIKRPAHAKKKSAAINGNKKPNRKHTEKSESVGFDEVLHPPDFRQADKKGTPVSSTRQSSLAPSVASTSSYDSSARKSKQLYCICRKPDQGSWMINCEVCNDWFHGTCVSLEESDEPLIDTYICPVCTSEGKGKTSWIRKCRLQGCNKPAVQQVKPIRGGKGTGTRASKYCSDEHALEFFKSKIQNLDPESLTPSQLKSLVRNVPSIDDFKRLGDAEPTVPDPLLAKYRTPADDSRLADLRLEREKLVRKMEIVALRQTFLHLAMEKAKQLNTDLKMSGPTQLAVGKSKAKTKAKEICAFDDRLLLGDAEFLEWTATEEGKRVLGERKIEGEEQCMVEKRRCRHREWQALRGEDILMEESLLREQLEGLAREEKTIRYARLNYWATLMSRERQKVRARNASPGNGQAIAISAAS